VDSLITRISDTLAQADGRFPVTADPSTAEWQWSSDGGWVGGFWVGLLRLAAWHVGEQRYRDAADAATAQLAARASAPTLLRGFLFWYSHGLAATLGQGDVSGAAHRAAQELAQDLDQTAGVIPTGDEDAEQYEWPRPGACADGLPGTVPLLYACGRGEAAAIHTDGTYRFCVRDDGSVSQDATYDDAGELVERTAINGIHPDSTWSRAQAWAMLGFAQAAVRDEQFRPMAEKVASWWLAHLPSDHIAHWDFDDPAVPDAPRDTSATAIAAAALLKLGHRDDAATTVDALVRRIGPHGLIDGCYNRKKNVAVGHELIWGDYFLLESILGLHHGLDTTLL
jgi:unsaturated chondroitin disaccharide hydrolase